MNGDNRDEERADGTRRKARNEKIPIDWRIVKVDQTRLAEEWAKETE